jgi:hypothetical protein
VKDGLKVVAVVAGVLAIILGFYFFGVYVFGGAQRSTAEFRGETDAIERLKADGDYRIQIYDQFHDLCAAVQTDEAQIAGLQEELKSVVISESRREILNASITGVRASRAEKINQYNADSAKDFTKAAFKDLSLPYRLDINDKETQCAS